MKTHTSETLPKNDNINDYSFNILLDREWFIAKGAMIAYYGSVTFDAAAAFASRTAWAAAAFSSPIYIQDWVVATGKGNLVIADRGFNVNSFDLDDGNLTIKATNLLAFDKNLELKQSIVPGFVTLLGTGKFVASSNGPVIFIKPPFRADPEALLGWADCPTPAVHHDTGWMSHTLMSGFQAFLGRRTGEERQYDFTSQGDGDILLQSSEIVREDPAVLRLIESQTDLLTQGQKQTLAQKLVQQTNGQNNSTSINNLSEISNLFN